MLLTYRLIAALAVTSICYCDTSVTAADDDDDPSLVARAQELLDKINREYGEWNYKVSIAAWNYASNITDENLSVQLNVSAEVANYVRQVYKEVTEFPWENITDYNIRRQFKKLATPGSAALSQDKYMQYDEVINKMQSTYSTAKVCQYKNTSNCNLSLEPELTEIMIHSRDPEELKYVWQAWRNVSGKNVKEDFTKYVELSNEIARLNNYSDMAAFWMKEYEADDFPQQIESLWQQIKPLYLELHAYVRGQLRKKYGDDVVSKDGPIPAHLLGNMWAQTWNNIADFTTPYPGKKLPDVTDAMVAQGYNETTIFRVAEDFFTSLNLSAMPELFWKNSILKKPPGVELICHASAWDFYDGNDFRIKQCTRINMEDLLTAHHEMGHIQYFLQYKNQPTVYKEGANPGFHEAVGDTIALSASTPEHLQEIGLLDDPSTSDEAVLNHLYLNGLDKIVFLPFAYMMDKWRWGVFQSKIKPDTYNCEWWSLAEEFQGIVPPVERSEDDFDPGAKYHIVASVEYIRYFVSFVVQFQFHKSLCIEAGQYDPENPQNKALSECNIYGNKAAGKLFQSMLELGSSRPWPDAMEKITGQRKMDASGLLEYFKPLMDWLKTTNAKNNEVIGWQNSDKTCMKKPQV
ncbi:angiotensin-converting enzyme-like [Microplitis mediator]|uniref:angiotensin-converting enzyme-like n=1 Tax=Microplitis mediator TaxID=375433 RepID=UPI002557C665|nr:angiotensin-converting enzyme-like [Microplitis mediator]